MHSKDGPDNLGDFWSLGTFQIDLGIMRSIFYNVWKWLFAHWLPLVLMVLLVGGTGAICWYVPGWKEQLGLIGSVASVLGIIYVIVEILITKREVAATKRVAEATQLAVAKALEELRDSHRKYKLMNAKHLVKAINDSIQARQWIYAWVRISDLAEELMELATSFPESNEVPASPWLQVASSPSLRSASPSFSPSAMKTVSVGRAINSGSW